MGNAACWGSPQVSHRAGDSLTAVAPADAVVLEKGAMQCVTLTDTPQRIDRSSPISSAPEHNASPEAAIPAVEAPIDLLMQKDDGAADVDSTRTTAAPELCQRDNGLDDTIRKALTHQRRPSLEAPPHPLMLFAQFGCEQQSTAAHLADGSPTLRARDAERSFSVLSRSSPSVTFAEVVFIARPDPKATGSEERPPSVSPSAFERQCAAQSDMHRGDAFDNIANPIARRFSSQTATSISSVSASDVQPVSPTTALEDSSAWVDTVPLDDHCAEGMRYSLPIGMRRPRNTPALRRMITESRTCTSVPVVLLGSTSGRQSRGAKVAVPGETTTGK